MGSAAAPETVGGVFDAVVVAIAESLFGSGSGVEETHCGRIADGRPIDN